MHDTILARLRAARDPAYQAFQCKLMPTVDPQTVLGVRTPELRRIARSLRGAPETEDFLARLPHRYYEENNLHGLLICALRDYDETVAALEAFLPFVDNWATCDLLSPAAFRRRPPQLPEQIRRWLDSGRCYTVRFGLGTLLRFYLDDDFRPEYLDWAASVRSEEYYVNMMIAWYLATALAKQYDAALPLLTGGALPLWVHNKTIQKAVESYRISPDRKDALRSLRRKA